MDFPGFSTRFILPKNFRWYQNQPGYDAMRLGEQNGARGGRSLFKNEGVDSYGLLYLGGP